MRAGLGPYPGLEAGRERTRVSLASLASLLSAPLALTFAPFRAVRKREERGESNFRDAREEEWFKVEVSRAEANGRAGEGPGFGQWRGSGLLPRATTRTDPGGFSGAPFQRRRGVNAARAAAMGVVARNKPARMERRVASGSGCRCLPSGVRALGRPDY